MSSDVPLQAAVASKAYLTVMTSEGFLVSVPHQMSGQITRLREPGVTRFAHIGSFTCVHSHV